MENGTRTFNADILRQYLKIGETRTYLGYCHPDEIERLKKEGFEVKNYDFGYEEIDVTRLR